MELIQLSRQLLCLCSVSDEIKFWPIEHFSEDSQLR